MLFSDARSFRAASTVRAARRGTQGGAFTTLHHRVVTPFPPCIHRLSMRICLSRLDTKAAPYVSLGSVIKHTRRLISAGQARLLYIWQMQKCSRRHMRRRSFARSTSCRSPLSWAVRLILGKLLGCRASLVRQLWPVSSGTTTSSHSMGCIAFHASSPIRCSHELSAERILACDANRLRIQC